MIRKLIAFLRGEAKMGDHARKFETDRYSEDDLHPVYDAQIIVPADSEDFADVSFYQGVMDWVKYKVKASYVLLRVGQNTWVDTQFENSYTGAKEAGVKVGGYVFVDDRVSPQTQANTVFNALKGRPLDGYMVIDWERNFGGAYFGLQHVISLIKLLKANNVQCKGYLIYTGYYFWREHSSEGANATEYRYIRDNDIGLHIAWYASAEYVRIPEPWATWVDWQSGTPAVGLEWGAQSIEIDMNSHNGKLDFGGTTLPTGEAMYKCIRAVAFRSGPNYPDPAGVIGELAVGDYVRGTIATGVNPYIPVWLNFNRIWRNGSVEEGVDGWVSAHPTYLQDASDWTPPGEPEPEPSDPIASVHLTQEFVFKHASGATEIYRIENVEVPKVA
jgi:hypothetical protein